MFSIQFTLMIKNYHIKTCTMILKKFFLKILNICMFILLLSL